MVAITPNYDTSYSGIGPSTTPQRGASIAVSAMTNAQLSTWLYSDVSLGATGQDKTNNGMITLLADGRAGSIQDHADRMYARRQLGLGNAG
jgi:hypothetical protein